MDFEQKEGFIAQENAAANKKSLLKEHKFMLLSTLFIITATLFVTLLPRNNKISNIINKPIITPPLVIITATPSPEPSVWASSSAILKIEKEARDLLGNIISTDYQDPVLSLPNIETRVDLSN